MSLRFASKNVIISFTVVVTFVFATLILPPTAGIAGEGKDKPPKPAKDKIDVCHITGTHDFGEGDVPIGHVINISESAHQAHIKHGHPERWVSFTLPDDSEVCLAEEHLHLTSTNNSWMKDIGYAIEDQKLNYIALPGTHESGTSNIDRYSAFADDGNPHPCVDKIDDIERSIKKWLEDHLWPDSFADWIYGHFVKPEIEAVRNICDQVQADWSKSQRTGIYQQLIDGIRYFDLRVLYDSGSNEFYVIHSLVSIPFHQVLDDVKRFYSDPAHSQELVLLDINHTYHMTDLLHERLIQKINDTLDGLLIPRSSGGLLTDLTIRTLWDRSQSERVIVFYDSTSFAVDAYPELWSQDKIISHWPNTTDMNTLFRALWKDAWNIPDVIRDKQKNGGFYVLQSIRTANENTIKQSVTTTLWHYLDGIPIISDYIHKIWDHYGWCSNCCTNLLAYGASTNWHSSFEQLVPDKIFAEGANIIIIDSYSNIYWPLLGHNYNYVDSVKQMNLTRYCNNWTNVFYAYNQYGNKSRYGGIALHDINGNDAPEMFVLNIDDRQDGTPNDGWISIGMDIDERGIASSLIPPVALENKFGVGAGVTVGGGIGVADINGNGRPEVFAHHIYRDGAVGEGRYYVGWDVSPDGKISSWRPSYSKDGNYYGPHLSEGGGIALHDINDNDVPDMVVFNIDLHSDGYLYGWYSVGMDIDANGDAASWTAPRPLPFTLGYYVAAGSAGGGVDLADINGNGIPDMIFYNIKARIGEDTGHYNVLWDISADGNYESFSDFNIAIPTWFGASNQGGGFALGDINHKNGPDMVMYNIDDPPGYNYGWYRIGFDLDHNGHIANRTCEE